MKYDSNVDTGRPLIRANITQETDIDTRRKRQPRTYSVPCTQAIVTASRALGTVYQNTSGTTIIVTVSAYGAAGYEIDAYVEAGDTTPDTLVAYSGGVADVTSVTFCVPDQSYYKVTQSGATLAYWTEWTLG
jgi:hypothetical protein